VTLKTPEAAYRQLKITALNAYCLPVKQGIGYFLPCRIQQAGEGAPRDIHLPGAFFLIQSFQVLKTDCLGFCHKKPDFLKFSHSYPGGLEVSYKRYGTDLSP
jgi:hypothetical protein